MESGACALGAGLLQPQTGRPVTKQALHRAGSDNDDSSGHRHREYSQRDNNTDSPEHSEYREESFRPARVVCASFFLVRAFAGGCFIPTQGGYLFPVH